MHLIVIVIKGKYHIQKCLRRFIILNDTDGVGLVSERLPIFFHFYLYSEGFSLLVVF